MKKNLKNRSFKSNLLGLTIKSFMLVLFTTNYSYAFLPVFPLEPNASSNTIHKGAGRFGEGRKAGNPPVGFGTYGHQGVDISGKTKGRKDNLYAVADSEVVGAVNTGGGGGIGTALRPLNGPDIVVVYWHQSSIQPNVRIGNRVSAGDYIGNMGNTSVPAIPAQKSSMANHLHIGIGVRDPGLAVNLWLNNTPKVGGKFYQTGLGGSSGGASHTPQFKKKSYLWTNPAPYLNRDVLIETTTTDHLKRFLGNSIRSQYNALTGSNLPLGPGAVKGVDSDKVPKVKIQNNGIPSNMATEMAQSSVVGALESGNADELLGQDSITPEVLAYYAPPRTVFVGNQSDVKIDIGDGDITQEELIEKIGTSRFGNSAWQKELVTTSMRGMLGEYLNMINAKNFIKKEQIKQKERIESLYAAWSSQVTKLNHEAKLQEINEKNIESVEIPDVSVLPVEELYEMIDQGLDVSNVDLTKAVSLTEGQYKGCVDAYRQNLYRQPAAKRKELLSLALRLGFHPNDFATAVAAETSFISNLDKMYPKAYQVKNKKGEMVTYYPAGGFIQLTKGGAGDIPYDKLVSLYPGAGPIIKKHLGSNMRSGAMRNVHGPYLRELGNHNARWEFAVYDGYFYSKNRNFINIKPSDKTLGLLYKMIFGISYSKHSKSASSRAGYADNKQYDLDGNGIITAEEAVKHKNFRDRNCPYWTDEAILKNSTGLTNEDLKLIPWSPAYARAHSPTIDNVGGNFMYIQSLKAKLNKEGNQ